MEQSVSLQLTSGRLGSRASQVVRTIQWTSVDVVLYIDDGIA